MKRYLLDTNLLLGFTRRAAWAQWVDGEDSGLAPVRKPA